ncbi:hypothetical protein FRC12_009657 [Ceratobasidium sp. 428]|nr:hypothetical protein FRC12_009657 [Ceratobasidium sp. 428]
MIIALDLLQDRCPKLKQLGLISSISSPIAPPDLSAQTAVAQMVYAPMILSRLKTFQSLLFLQIPGGLINSESFALIARLPKLESHHIRNDLTRNDNLMRILRSTSPSDNPFPAITKFHVISSQLEVTLTDFRIDPHAPPVTLVKLQYQPNRDDDIAAPRGHVIGRLSFPARKLSSQSWPTYVGEMRVDWEQPPRVASRDSTWNYVKQLPLVQLSIMNSRTDPPFMREIFPVFPTLLSLDMPNQSLTLGHLARLSQLAPRLLFFGSNLVDILDEVPQIQHRSTAPLQVFDLVCPLERRLEVRSPDKVARFLSSIWPRIQEVKYENQSRETQPGLELLNMHLQVARGVAATKKNISARFGADLVSSLLDRRLSSF